MKVEIPKRIIAIVLCLMAFMAPAKALEWNTYTNMLYGYQICYPANLLKPQGESDNGDGNSFTSPTGATLKVWGSYNAADESLTTLTTNLVPEVNGRAAAISYKYQTATFSVVTGRNGNAIFYEKIILDKDGYRAFQIVYPEHESDIYNSVTAKLSACFQ